MTSRDFVWKSLGYIVVRLFFRIFLASVGRFFLNPIPRGLCYNLIHAGVGIYAKMTITRLFQLKSKN